MLEKLVMSCLEATLGWREAARKEASWGEPSLRDGPVLEVEVLLDLRLQLWAPSRGLCPVRVEARLRVRETGGFGMELISISDPLRWGADEGEFIPFTSSDTRPAIRGAVEEVILDLLSRL